MPFCSKCGSQVENDAVFCYQCGSKIYNPSQVKSEDTVISPANTLNSQMPMQQNTRAESIAELDRMISYFDKKQDEYDEYDKYSEKVTYYSNPRTRVSVDVGRGTGFKVTGIVIFAISLTFLMVSCGLSGIGSSSWDFLFILFILLIAVGGFLIMVGEGKNKSFVDAQKQTKQNLLKEFQKKRNSVAESLTDYYQGYENCKVSSLYSNPKILSIIKGILISGRADTLKEAINLMIQDANYTEKELQAAMTSQSASAAGSTKAATFFSVSQFSKGRRR